MLVWHVFDTVSEYRALRYSALLKVEEIGGVPSTQPYLDSQRPPDPTIGVGFNLTVGRNQDAILTNMGFNVINASEEEQPYIDRIRAAINLLYENGANDTLRDNLNEVMRDWSDDEQVSTQNAKPKRSSFTLFETEVAEVFEVIVPDYEDLVGEWEAMYELETIPISREAKGVRLGILHKVVGRARWRSFPSFSNVVPGLRSHD